MILKSDVSSIKALHRRYISHLADFEALKGLSWAHWHVCTFQKGIPASTNSQQNHEGKPFQLF
jgi:hypothetical protein